MKAHRRIHHHLKSWLVPHRHNDHRPHLIRGHGLALFMLLILGIQGAAVAARTASAPAPIHGQVLAYATSITPVDLLNQTNAQRAANGLPALRLDARLNQSAQLKAQNMFTENYWAHVSPGGLEPWHWFAQAGYKYSFAGENLAKDFDTTSGAIEGWMNSSGHKANILDTDYTDVGFAVVNGTLVGGETTLVVAHYGAPAGAAAAVVPAAPAKPKAAPAKPKATSAPTPAPQATPAPTLMPSPAVKPVSSTGTITQAAPPPKDYSLFAPLRLTATLGWSTYVTLVLFVLLFLVYATTHLAVWGKGLRRWRSLRYRTIAGAQVAGLAAIMLYLSTSGFGRVG